MSDEPSGFPVDVKGQKAWAKELIHAACDMLDRAKAGEVVTKDEEQLRVNGVRFAFRRAKELGFTAELHVLMLARGVHILAKEYE
jgi:hypothetical protein